MLGTTMRTSKISLNGVARKKGESAKFEHLRWIQKPREPVFDQDIFPVR